MQVSKLITQVREDYIDDADSSKYLWSDASLLRKFTEAERQACNRANLIYDDSTYYTRLTLVSGQANYDIDPKITVVENIIFDGDVVVKKTREELDRLQPTWRTDTGMAGKVIYAVITGKQIRFNYIPDATDAGTYVYLEVYRLPDADIVTASQEPEIPEEYQRDLIYWVLHECYKKQDVDTFNQEKSDYFLARFDEVFGPYVSARVRQHQFENPRSTHVRPISYTSSTQTVTDFDYDV